jgi:hypothetical protein
MGLDRPLHVGGENDRNSSDGPVRDAVPRLIYTNLRKR